MLRFATLALLAAILLASAHPVAAGCLLRPGDRMVFFGDSITEQRIYTRYVMDYFALRYPGRKFEFRNAGWVSDTAAKGLDRLQRGVLDLKPTVVSICFGMNDAGVTAYDQKIYDRYIGGMKQIIDELRTRNIKVVLLTPGCVDESKAARLAGYNATLGRFAKQLCEFAAQQSIPCYNIHEPMLATLNRAKAADPAFVMMNDGVHPQPSGHMVMAYGLLKAMGCAEPASGLTIDAAQSKATCERCKVDGLKVSSSEISFSRTDDALPIYLDESAWSAARFFPDVGEITSYRLTVAGLKQGKWGVLVENQPVGVFTADELAEGVNLAAAPGPWKKLADEVNEITREQESVYYNRWRQIQLAVLPEAASKEKKALLDKLDAIIASREADRISRAAGPHTWKWVLRAE